MEAVEVDLVEVMVEAEEVEEVEGSQLGVMWLVVVLEPMDAKLDIHYKSYL